MTSLVAFSDQSDMAPWPTWVWVVLVAIPCVLLLAAVVVNLTHPTDAAAAPDPALGSRRASTCEPYDQEASA